jgi:hypothetical protein
MHVVSLHLPELRALRLAGQAPPTSLPELYLEIRDLLQDLDAAPATPKELRDDSGRLKGRLMEMVDGLELDFSPQAARDYTLAAMTGGMFSGALDGTLLFSQGQRASQPGLKSAHAFLGKPSRLLWENLDRVLAVAQDSWAAAHVDDLQLLSGYGKHENRDSLEEGEGLERQTRGDRSQFQAFLLASFKGGYAMGVVDAAVIFVGGERPASPPG